jgi:hypothetical protein
MAGIAKNAGHVMETLGNKSAAYAALVDLVNSLVRL